MSKLSRYNDMALIHLNSLTDEEVMQIPNLNSIHQLLDEKIIRIVTVDGFDKDIDEENLKFFLVDNYDNDLQCAIKIYQTFNNLDSIVLLDNKMWTYYSAYVFYDYTIRRHGVERNSLILKNTSMKNILNNSISRLWWIVNLTRNPNSEFKYELTKFIFDNPIFLDTIFTLKYVRTKNFINYFFNSLRLFDSSHMRVSKTDINFITDIYSKYKEIEIYYFIDAFEVSDMIKILDEVSQKYLAN